uniref:Nitrite reductase n=1 Tax=Cyprinus carpio TaxID=7962 RepID=A0A8C1HN72_CYPCA
MEKLSEKEKGLIRDSWESLGKNKVPHGIVLFTRLFELDPALLTLFSYSTNCGVAPECLSSPEFLEHVTKVMLVIDAAVSHLDDLHTLEDFLLNLGRKHQAVGVKTQSFTVSTLCLHGLVKMTEIIYSSHNTQTSKMTMRLTMIFGESHSDFSDHWLIDWVLSHVL